MIKLYKAVRESLNESYAELSSNMSSLSSNVFDASTKSEPMDVSIDGLDTSGDPNEITKSVNDVIEKPVFVFQEKGCKLAQAFNVAMKRFEKGTGIRNIRKDIFQLKPVSFGIIKALLQAHEKNFSVKFHLHFQFSNNELDASDIELDGLYTFKSIHDFDDNKVETFADEVMRVENSEVVFTEYAVQVLFCMDRLGDQRIYCETSLEQSPFGTNSNYRTKILVSTVTYIFPNL